MTLPDGSPPDVIILGVSFGDDYEAVTIYYVESRNVAPQAHKKEEITLDKALLPAADVADFIDTIQEWVDKGLIHIRDKGGVSE
jgi:hypothetical protein